MKILAIDPGTTESAWVEYDIESRLPLDWAKVPNGELLGELDTRWLLTRRLVIEQIVSYGKPVGQETFDTCVWIGRFQQKWLGGRANPIVALLSRPDVKLHMCGSRTGVTDAVMRTRLIDLYGGSRRAAVGLKASPGPLYGMAKDCWQALAVARTYAETGL